MISSGEAPTRTYCRLITVAVLIVVSPVYHRTHADESATKPVASQSPKNRLTGPSRLPSEMMSRSLGYSAGIIATGGLILLLTRRFAMPGTGFAQGYAIPNEDNKPRITSRIRLTNRQMVHVMQMGDRVLVLGTGAHDAPVLLAQWPSSYAEHLTASNGHDIAATTDWASPAPAESNTRFLQESDANQQAASTWTESAA